MNCQTRVYVHGVWDLFHYGHVKFLENVKLAMPGTYLIVGVVGQEGLPSCKKSAVMSGAERSEMVRACRYVDEVMDDCPYFLPPDFGSQLYIDYYGCSETALAKALFNPFKFLEGRSKFVVIPRTPHVSSADIIKRIMGKCDTYS
ncbi:Nucleotidylyl transferase [Didymella exigua CBS 183.55]|uniref:choline-phosphate cytidylyltransferase n=1 Tax=Didymella exigua CBS 183.55 TaxID=1150837 RepID=A0A6A5S1M7_9PLEO|nr:Nucleotidylyl transferase [Didymella exigua CBS 183.55]KAF1933689.1 Nucleotidylyl transferase [Didymella exigua CBS 183.55]